MAESIVGMHALQARLKALEGVKSGRMLMDTAGALVMGEMRKNMPRKTGLTAASMQKRAVTETSVEIHGSRVARWIDQGTGLFGPHHQRIFPLTATVLAWRTGAVRLSGASRIRKGVQLAGWAYARSIAGMKARPFIRKSVAEASKTMGRELANDLVKTWNDAA